MGLPLPKLRELKEAIIALVRGPYTTKFPAEPASIVDEYRGAPEYQEDGCVACGGCENVCPAGAIETIDVEAVDRPFRRMVRHFDECIFCGQCVELCTTGDGIEYSKRYDLSTDKREEQTSEVEKELCFCACCNSIISAYEHIVWVAKKLGHKAYSNPTLYLTKLAELQLIDRQEISSKIRDEIDRDRRMGILCPACRRDASLFEAHHEVESPPDFDKE